MEVPNANGCQKNLPKSAKMYLELFFFEKDLCRIRAGANCCALASRRGVLGHTLHSRVHAGVSWEFY